MSVPRRRNGWRLVTASLGAFLLAAAPRGVGAQGSTAWRLSFDNDALALWVPGSRRSDREYTSGAFASLEYAGRSALFGALRSGCAAACLKSTHTWTVGQEIYTGHHLRQFADHPSRRANAAWLHLRLEDRDSTERAGSTLSLAVGVVGPPALGEPVQRLFHRVTHAERNPFDWSVQLPFEPAFVARYARDDYVVRLEAGAWSATLGSRMLASVGTIRTEAGLGGGAALRLPPPTAMWAGVLPQVSLAADVTFHAVARNEFIDGTMFRSSRRLEREWLHDERGLTASLQWRRLGLIYRGRRTGREYVTQIAPQLWGSVAVEWRPE